MTSRASSLFGSSFEARLCRDTSGRAAMQGLILRCARQRASKDAPKGSE